MVDNSERLLADKILADKNAEIWRLLENVKDPEIPVISVIDLGIIRNIHFNNDRLNDCDVIITPTYSGCPAMEVISQEICDILKQNGVTANIKTSLSPAWTTDWLTDKGKAQLKAYGIAPPAHKSHSHKLHDCMDCHPPAIIACPRCNSVNTICVSQFGSTSCKALYSCRDCLEPFDYFKTH